MILTRAVCPNAALWQHLRECIDYERGRFFRYRAKERLDGFATGGAIGNFTFVLLNESQRRCMMLSGWDGAPTPAESPSPAA